MNEPFIGSYVRLSHGDIVVVTEITERGFKYAGATPISIPRLGMHGTGEGEYFSKINPQAAWEYAEKEGREKFPT